MGRSVALTDTLAPAVFSAAMNFLAFDRNGSAKSPVLVLDPLTARQFIDRGGFDTKAKLIRWLHETAEMPAARYWDLQLIQNYVYTRATFGESPKAKYLNVAHDAPVRIFEEEDINVVVTGGEANGYWQMYGARHKATVSVDDWR